MANEEEKQKDEYIFEAEIDSKELPPEKVAPPLQKASDNGSFKSAYEMLTEKLQEAADNPPLVAKSTKPAKPEKSTFEKVATSSITKSIIRTAGNTIVRSLLGSLGLGGTTRRKRTNWF